MKRPRQGASLVDMAMTVGYLAVVAAAAVYGAWTWGWVGALVGLAVGAVAPIAFIGVLDWLEKWLWMGEPYLPTCSNGRCGVQDYQIDTVEGDLVYTCNCGLRFRKQGRKFIEEMEDGSFQRYLVWKPFRGWYRDE